MANEKGRWAPRGGRHPIHAPAPAVPKDGVNAALLAVYTELSKTGPLTPDRRAEAQRLFKRARDWSRTRAARRAALWAQVVRAGREANLSDAQLREIASRGIKAAARPDLLDEPRGVHELSPRLVEERADRELVVAYSARGKSPSEVVAMMAGRRSRAWVYRVLQRLKKFGDVADRRTVRRVRERRIPPDVSLLLESFCFRRNAKPTIAAVHRQLRRACDECQLPIPSESWVRQQLAQEPQLKLLWIHGPKAYQRQYRPVTVRDLGVRAGEAYQVDSTPLDVWLQDRTPSGRLVPLRPALTQVIDVATRAVVGFYLSRATVDATSVLSAVLHAIAPSDELEGFYGKPNSIQFDHGSEASADVRARLEAIGIEVLRTPLRSPDLQGKVERSIGSAAKMLGVVPGCVAAIGGSSRAAEKVVESLWSFHTFRRWLLQEVAEHNEVAIHRGLGMTRRMAWEEGATPTLATEEELLSLLPGRRTVDISHGIISVQEQYRRHHFVADFLADLPQRRVELRYLDFEAPVHIFDPDTGRYLGPATPLSASTTEAHVDSIRRQRMELRARRGELLMPRLMPAVAETMGVPDDAKPPEAILIVESIEPIPVETDADVGAEGAAPVAVPEADEDEQVVRLRALRQERAS